MLRRLIFVALATLAVGAIPGPARAGDDQTTTETQAADTSRPDPARTIAVLSIEISGDAAPELRAQVQESLRLGLEAAGFALVPRERVAAALTALPELADCTSATCLQQLGDEVGASQFVRAQVTAAGAAYTIRLELLSPEIEGQVARRIEDSCPVCTIVELGDHLRDSAGKLIAAPTQPVSVVIVTRPQGAALSIDDHDVGPGPFKGELPPGPHRVTALLPGHLEADQTITVSVSTSGAARFEIILSPAAVVEAAPAPKPRYRVWKWVAAGGAAAALVTGIAMIAVDGDGSCSTSGTECEERYATLAPGVVSLLVGVGLGGASGWMFVSDRRAPAPPEQKPRAALTPLPGGALAGITLSF